jgi:hypothetical protein
MVQPARIGWRGKRRQVDLTIERPFSGEELAGRMKGWVTADPEAFCETVRACGWLKVFDDGGLVVEVEDETQLRVLERTLAERFGEEIDLEIPKE